MADITNNCENIKTKKSSILLISCAVVILLMTGIIIFLLTKKTEDSLPVVDAGKPKREVLVNEKNIEKVIGDFAANSSVRPGSFRVSMNTTWHFEKGDAVSYDARVNNLKVNTNPVYFDVMLSDSEEVIYESPIISLGSTLDEIKLNRKLEKGRYDCVLVYHLVDEEQNAISKLMMALDIVVEN